MLSIDEIGNLLDSVAEELPEELFAQLNGGVSLLHSTKMHEADMAGNLYIMGEYCHDQMGRYIVIYYGSICAVCEHETEGQIRARLKKLLAHELTHHMESLAGERGLEVRDAETIEDYRRRMS